MTSMMPNEIHTETPSSNGGASPSGGLTANVQEKAANAQEKMARVADEVPAQAGKVAHDVKAQLRETTRRTLGDVREQADDRATRAAQGLRDLSTRAQALADGRTAEAGNVGELVNTFAREAGEFAQRLETGGVQGLLDDASRFGRKRPIAFLALAVGAGFLAGRLVRTGAEVTSSGDDSDLQAASPSPASGGMSVVDGKYTEVFA